ERDAELLGLPLRACVREDFGAATAMRAEEVAHVLNDAEERHLNLLEHGDAAPRVDQRQIVGRRDDHRAAERHVLGLGQLGMPGAPPHIPAPPAALTPVRVPPKTAAGTYPQSVRPRDPRAD